MSLITADSNPPVQANVNCPWAQNMDFVNAAFGYQKEALELRHLQNIHQHTSEHKSNHLERLGRKRLALVMAINMTLRSKNDEIVAQNKNLEYELECVNNKTRDVEAVSRKIHSLSYTVAMRAFNHEQSSPEIIAECKQEISRAQNMFDGDYEEIISSLVSKIQGMDESDM